ncbi:hypothetical protein EJ06DRAFT_173319 [Trichodelitschia bisporula]|uniref:C2H2-type domain-containing protein n=1 Tax=Trichodelitschia bisporula TaxID=703511 RepID=A0A6G1HLE0_9PEZI|nr:hypothetical protein EJ06DRAFT_173319 [Trichodelitschia bisporula]
MPLSMPHMRCMAPARRLLIWRHLSRGARFLFPQRSIPQRKTQQPSRTCRSNHCWCPPPTRRRPAFQHPQMRGLILPLSIMGTSPIPTTLTRTSYGTRAEAWAYSTYTSPSGYQPENAFMTSHPGSSCDPLSPASADADYASLRGLSLREEHPDTASHSSAPLPGCKPRGRRGRRRAADQSMRPAYRQHMLPSEDNKRFPCTLGCNSCFRTKADWKRHEATHVPAAWICMPEGKESAIRAGRCIFCGERNPTTAHFKAHNLKACLMRPVQDRGFARKDNLKQHIQQVHLKGSGEGFALGDFASEQSGLLDEWNREPDASTVDQAAMWCGFCNHSDFASWRERMDHVGLHFVQPYDVRDWEMASDSERM